MNSYIYQISAQSDYYESQEFPLGFFLTFEDAFESLEDLIRNPQNYASDQYLTFYFTRHAVGMSGRTERIFRFYLTSDLISGVWEKNKITYTQKEISAFFDIAVQAGFQKTELIKEIFEQFHDPEFAQKQQEMRENFRNELKTFKNLFKEDV